MLASTEEKPMRFIYDLDHTIIDSSHRQATLPNGDLDLAHWIDNSTPEKVMQDSLLPLAEHWRNVQEAGMEIVICTARVMGDADYQFLAKNGLYYNACLSRREGDRTSDALLKERALRAFASECAFSWARFCLFSEMFDDNLNVINHLTARGLKVHNAISLNKELAA
jgi:hypothetical protein